MHVVADELQCIEVAGHDDGLQTLPLGFTGQRSQYIVRFIPVELVDCHIERVGHLSHSLELHS